MSVLKSDIWVSALLRRASVAGAFGAVVARGDSDAGAVVVKVNLLDGRVRLRAPAIDLDGARIWINPLGAASADDDTVLEAEADAYVKRRRDRDPDVWVVEIEDRHGRDFIE